MHDAVLAKDFQKRCQRMDRQQDTRTLACICRPNACPWTPRRVKKLCEWL